MTFRYEMLHETGEYVVDVPEGSSEDQVVMAANKLLNADKTFKPEHGEVVTGEGGYPDWDPNGCEDVLIERLKDDAPLEPDKDQKLMFDKKG